MSDTLFDILGCVVTGAAVVAHVAAGMGQALMEALQTIEPAETAAAGGSMPEGPVDLSSAMTEAKQGV